MHDDAILRMCSPQYQQGHLQHVNGLVTAKVVRIEDNGMYRLQFLGMNGQDDDTPSTEARCMMPMAGARRGMHFLPEPGDEVVVGFQAGETSIPIILGAVWNGDAQPPSQARQSTTNDVRTIVSRSGHELTFDDTDGSQKVTLRTQGGHVVEMDDAPAGLKITIRSNGGHTMELVDRAPGKIAIFGPGCQIVLNDSGDLSLDATTAINLTAPTITLNATAVTVGSAAGATTIDGIPFRPHKHVLGSSTTGPVAPV